MAHPVPLASVCVLQAQTQELEELNKELRQCNLQQFIQQTGATVTVLQARSEEDAQPEPSPRELPACRRNGGQHAAAGSAAGGCSAGPLPAPCLPLQGDQHPLQGGRPQNWPVLPWVLRLDSRDGVSVLAQQSLTTPGGVSKVCQPQGSSLLPSEALRLLVAMLKDRITVLLLLGLGRLQGAFLCSIAACHHGGKKQVAEGQHQPLGAVGCWGQAPAADDLSVFSEGRASMVPGATSASVQG